VAITKQDEQALAQVYADYHDRYGGQKQDYFALLYLPKKFKCRVEDIAAQVAFGNNDYGLDAYYVDREGRNLYLFQFKWSENQGLFKESFERLTKEGMELIFGAGKQEPTKNEFLHRLRDDLFEHQALIDRVYIQFVFKGDVNAAENSEGLKYRKENLENKRHLIEAYLKRDTIPVSVEFISDRRTPGHRPPKDSHTISFSEHVTVNSGDEEKTLHVGFVPLYDLYQIYQSLGQNFFSRNIRAGLSPDNPPNRRIREALAAIVLKEQLSPEDFAFNHNGITLAAERVDFEGESATIRVPRLLNGAQTITSFVRFIEDNQTHPKLKENDKLLKAIRVLAKIVVYDPSSEFVTNVTVCNNQQNPVDPWHLRANDKIQCDLQDKFIEEAQIFYSRQENAFQNLTDAELEELGVSDSKDIKIKALAQTFLAAQGEVDKMSRLPEVFESPKLYADTFRQSYLKADPRRIVLAYKVHLFLGPVVRRMQEAAAKKYAYAIGRARNLIWSLLVQALLNDAKISDLLDAYGTKLTKEADFRDYLQKLGITRLLPVLREVLSDSAYEEKIAEEQYAFLRAKEIYRRCMNEAWDRFEWTKRQL
jgi:hypothetical protein